MFRASQQGSLSLSTKKVFRQTPSARVVTTLATNTTAEPETYEVDLEKPIRLKFARGGDGACYVLTVPESAEYKDFEVGDKILKISASFGDEVWAAENYGQVMYAMKTRSGNVYMQLEKKNGDLTAMEPKRPDAFMNERNGGNYGSGTQELQEKNYQKQTTLSNQRKEMFNEGLSLFKIGKYDEALVVFENVVGLEPKNYIGDSMAKTTEVYRISQYNVACCYSMINQVDAGLEALNQTMRVGFEDFKMIRSDPSLANLRKDEDFDELMDKYDEPIFNENAFKAIKSLFGGGKK